MAEPFDKFTRHPENGDEENHSMSTRSHMLPLEGSDVCEFCLRRKNVDDLYSMSNVLCQSETRVIEDAGSATHPRDACRKRIRRSIRTVSKSDTSRGNNLAPTSGVRSSWCLAKRGSLCERICSLIDGCFRKIFQKGRHFLQEVNIFPEGPTFSRNIP